MAIFNSYVSLPESIPPLNVQKHVDTYHFLDDSPGETMGFSRSMLVCMRIYIDGKIYVSLP